MIDLKDLMLKHIGAGECFRAYKLLEDALHDLLQKNHIMISTEKEEHLIIQQADSYTIADLDELKKRSSRSSSGQPNEFIVSIQFNQKMINSNEMSGNIHMYNSL